MSAPILVKNLKQQLDRLFNQLADLEECRCGTVRGLFPDVFRGIPLQSTCCVLFTLCIVRDVRHF